MVVQKLKTALSAILIIKNWGAYFRDYQKGALPTQITFLLRNGLKFKLRSHTNDRVIFNEIWLRNVYVQSPRFKIGPKDIVVDIGAQIGFFSVYAAKKAAKGKVYAFEPAPENFALLQENLKINNMKNVIAMEAAVSGKSGTRDFFISKESVGGHSFVYDEGVYENMVRVEAIALHEFMERENIQIDFLKMDCEGAEYEILFNMPTTCLKKIRRVSMEYHEMDEERNGTKMKKFLEQNGFSVEERPEEGNMMYAKRS